MPRARRIPLVGVAAVLALLLVPLLIPVVAASDPRRLLYPYTAALDLACVAVCARFARRSAGPALKTQWWLFAAHCGMRALSTLVPAMRVFAGWPGAAANLWVVSVTASAATVFALLSLTTMGRQVNPWKRALDAALTTTLGTLIFLSVLSTRSSEFNVHYPRTTFVVGVFLLLMAQAAHRNAETSAERHFTSLARVYLAGRFLLLLGNNIVNYSWLSRPREFPFDLLFGVAPVMFLLAAGWLRGGGAQRPLPSPPLFVRNLAPSMVLLGVVLMSLDVYREHMVWAGASMLLAVLFFLGRTHLLYQRMVEEQQRLLERAGQLHTLATSDPLTGIGNRRWLEEVAGNLVAQKRAASLLLLDTDGFKQVNDGRGHKAGDDVLKAIADVLEAETDDVAGSVCARLGGDEFVVLLPAVDLRGAEAAAERMRQGVAERTREAGVPVTVSIGVAASSGPVELSALLQYADEALYRAKCRGRDAVESTAEDAMVLRADPAHEAARRLRKYNE